MGRTIRPVNKETSLRAHRTFNQVPFYWKHSDQLRNMLKSVPLLFVHLIAFWMVVAAPGLVLTRGLPPALGLILVAPFVMITLPMFALYVYLNLNHAPLLPERYDRLYVDQWNRLSAEHQSRLRPIARAVYTSPCDSQELKDWQLLIKGYAMLAVEQPSSVDKRVNNLIEHAMEELLEEQQRAEIYAELLKQHNVI